VTTGVTVEVVVPTVGRPSLHAALAPLLGPRAGSGRRRPPCRPRPVAPDGRGCCAPWGGGPAAARNVGLAGDVGEWVAFLDDDVLPPATGSSSCSADLAACGPDVGATQGRLRVPLPADRRPTDWERSTQARDGRLGDADMAYRRAAL
jgi:hypothetical protein